MRKARVSLSDHEIHSLGLKECVPRRESSLLDFTLKSFENVPLFSVQLVLKDGLPTPQSRVAFRL